MIQDMEMVITQLPLEDIAVVTQFNHRVTVTFADCKTLADSIHEQGQQTPIVVRTLDPERPAPHDSNYPSDKSLIEQGYKFKVISGHRRWTAFKHLQMQHGSKYDKISAIIRESKNVDEKLEYDLNAIENLQRTELTIYEEALAIRPYTALNVDPAEIAT